MMGTKGSAPVEPNVPNAIQANVRVNAGIQAAPSTKLLRPAVTAATRSEYPDGALRSRAKGSLTE